MTYKVYFHAPKCTFNPDPIWDQKWNYMDPCVGVKNFKNKIFTLEYTSTVIRLSQRYEDCRKNRIVPEINIRFKLGSNMR